MLRRTTSDDVHLNPEAAARQQGNRVEVQAALVVAVDEVVVDVDAPVVVVDRDAAPPDVVDKVAPQDDQ